MKIHIAVGQLSCQLPQIRRLSKETKLDRAHTYPAVVEIPLKMAIPNIHIVFRFPYCDALRVIVFIIFLT